MKISSKKNGGLLIKPKKKCPDEACYKKKFPQDKINFKQMHEKGENIAEYNDIKNLNKTTTLAPDSYGFKSHNDKASNLTNIVNALPVADKQTRVRWSKELIYKLHLIQTRFFDDSYVISLDCLYVDSNNNLLIDIIGSYNADEKILCYKPPEAYFRKNLSKNQIEIWSAGICIYFINALEFPWKKASVNDVQFRNYIKKKIFSHDLDKNIREILMLLLNVESAERQSMKSIVTKMHQTLPNLEIIS